jgi:DNA-binding transcriptional MerR regulator
VDRSPQVRGLLDAGLPIRVIKQLLPCLKQPRDILVSDVTPETIATLERERERMDRRVECPVRSREALSAYVETVRRIQRAEEAAGCGPTAPARA